MVDCAGWSDYQAAGRPAGDSQGNHHTILCGHSQTIVLQQVAKASPPVGDCLWAVPRLQRFYLKTLPMDSAVHWGSPKQEAASAHRRVPARHRCQGIDTARASAAVGREKRDDGSFAQQIRTQKRRPRASVRRPRRCDLPRDSFRPRVVLKSTTARRARVVPTSHIRTGTRTSDRPTSVIPHASRKGRVEFTCPRGPAGCRLACGHAGKPAPDSVVGVIAGFIPHGVGGSRFPPPLTQLSRCENSRNPGTVPSSSESVRRGRSV